MTMNKFAYYNEIDPFAAQWLRNLIKAGVIASGVVDERSISDVKPAEIKEFAQCHFFAGIGVWSYALRSAGWDDHRPVWTGSCPCQPFSTSGKGKGFSDERHLWPDWFYLIEICQPDTIFGEQVASNIGLSWLDTVQADLEASGYTNASVDLCAAGVGAPHIRQRIWFAAFREFTNTSSNRWEWGRESAEIQGRCESRSNELWKLPNGLERFAISDSEQTAIQNDKKKLAHSDCFGCPGKCREGEARIAKYSEAEFLADCNDDRQQPSKGREGREGCANKGNDAGRCCSSCSSSNAKSKRIQGTTPTTKQTRRENTEPSLPVNGFWRDADWVYCRDENYRPIEPGSIPLVNGVTSRMARESTDPETVRNHPKIRKGALKGYGNAINAEVAKAFIQTVMEYKP